MTFWEVVKNAWNGLDNPFTGTAKPYDQVTMPNQTYDFEGMKKLVAQKDPNVLIVDVREPSEYSIVSIPGSINVPYRSHPDGFTLGDAEFEKQFNVPKPSQDKELVFMCASGMRAGKAREVAASHGYSNTSIYPGSMNDWVSKGGDKLKF